MRPALYGRQAGDAQQRLGVWALLEHRPLLFVYCIFVHACMSSVCYICSVAQIAAVQQLLLHLVLWWW
jgi:hypothetical protein